MDSPLCAVGAHRISVTQPTGQDSVGLSELPEGSTLGGPRFPIAAGISRVEDARLAHGNWTATVSKSIGVDTLRRWLADRKAVTVLDIRTAEDRAHGRFPAVSTLAFVEQIEVPASVVAA